MKSLFGILAFVVSVALVAAVLRLWMPPNRSKPSFGLQLAIVFLSLLSLITRVWVLPGGPFISFHAEILPVTACLALAITAVRTVRQYSIVGRIGLYLVAVIASGISGFVIAHALSFWREYYPRGAIFGW